MRCLNQKFTIPMLPVGFLALQLAIPMSAWANPQASDSQEKDEEPTIKISLEETEQAEETIKLRHIGEGKTRLEFHIKAEFATVRLGEKKADLFHLTYTLPAEPNAPERPLTFCFNGGPGSSSVWLHLGGLSPYRVELGKQGPTDPNANVVEHLDTLLRVSDLVFVDPIGTGYSRPHEQKEMNSFTGYENDIRSLTEFIQQYLNTHQRWQSPVYLCGESYGGLRIAGLGERLWSRYEIAVRGLIFVSPALDFQTISFSNLNDLPYQTFLPGYAATAWNHGLLDKQEFPNVDKTVHVAEEFAMGEYIQALSAGASLSRKERKQVARRLEELTSIRARTWLEHDLRMNSRDFVRTILKKQKEIVGRFDGKFRGPIGVGRDKEHHYDPSYSQVAPQFAAAQREFLTKELSVDADVSYEILTSMVHPWSYEQFQNRYVSTARQLQRLMVENENCRALFVLGYTDLATPYAANTYAINHLDLPKEARTRVIAESYNSGHMMYLDEESRLKLMQDLRRFYVEDESRQHAEK